MSACTAAILAKIDNQQEFNNWAEGLGISNVSTGCTGVTGENQSNMSKEDGDKASADILKYMSCLGEKINTEYGDKPNTIARLQTAIQDLNTQIQKEEVNVQIAKERASFLGKGGSPPSYYDSWFPIGRPVKPQVVPVLLALIFFFTIVAFLFLLSYFGIEIKVLYPIYSSPAYGTAASTFFSKFPLSFWIVAAVLVGFLVYQYRK